MTWVVRRASSLFLLGFAIASVTFIIPSNTEEGFGILVQPKSMPIAMAWVIGFGALVTLFEPAGRDEPDIQTALRITSLIGLFGGAIWVTGRIGFEFTAPVLSLSLMLFAGERRWGWLAIGAAAMPLAIWVLFELVLGRPLP